MAENQNNANNYSASNIQVLEGLEAVRKRPAMYIGDISEKGLHHLVNETVDNSIDEAMAGYCTDIEVTINEDNSITVEDNGRGIPVDMHEKLHKSALEKIIIIFICHETVLLICNIKYIIIYIIKKIKKNFYIIKNFFFKTNPSLFF